MIIKSISLKDFQCYNGSHEDNKLEFSAGINLIVGENGGGKSKLFDAFYWAIYDQVFQSDTREFVYTRNYKENLLSDKAKRDCTIGGQVTAEVILVVIDSRDVEFRITRVFRAKKLNEREWQAEGQSKLLIEEYKTTCWQSVPSERHESILERVIPGHLKPYMWFQGEQVDSLMDFKNKSSLMQAINLLSDIGEYDDLVEIAKNGSKKAGASYTKAANLLSRNQNESKRLTSEFGKIESNIDKYEESRSNNTDAKNLAQINIDRLINQIDDAQKRTKLKGERERLSTEIDAGKISLDRRVEGLNSRLFSDFWLLKKAQPFFGEYSDKYKLYYQQHLDKVNSGKEAISKLPIDIPQPIHVHEMLSDEKCFVCGREARKGTDEYSHIEHLLSRQKEETEDVFKNDCSSFFQKIYNNALEFRHTISNIDKNIADEFKDINGFRSTVQGKSNQLGDIDKKFDELIGDDRSEDIVKEFKTHTNNMERYGQLLAEDEKNLDSLRKKAEHCQNNLDKLVVGTVDEKVASARDIWQSLSQITVEARKEVFSGLVQELELSANEIFGQMTAQNTSITGRLKLKMVSNESCAPEIVDNEGFILYGSNDSNIILVKLALIMAVITSRAQWSKNYCLVSDAPTSKMAQNYSHGFYTALGENFQQSIVMTYDFLAEEDRKALEHFKTASVYRIESDYPGGDREDRSDLSIKISRIL